MMTALSVSVLYLISASFCFNNWFNVFQKDTDLPVEEKRLSINVLLIATIAWPIVVPISFLEKHLRNQQAIEELPKEENDTAFSSGVVIPVPPQGASIAIPDVASLIHPAPGRAV